MPLDAAARLADVEAVFSAVAHAQRRQILLVLLYRGERVPAGDIANRFSCAWPTTTRHLGVLRDAGLVDVEHEGRHRYYRLNKDRLLSVMGGWLAHFGDT
jgi:DNA-binding transcriptional ArsR family regulator